MHTASLRFECLKFTIMKNQLSLMKKPNVLGADDYIKNVSKTVFVITDNRR